MELVQFLGWKGCYALFSIKREILPNGMLMGLTRTNDIRVVTLEAVFWHYLIKLAISMFLGFFITPVYLVYCLYKIVRLIIKR